MLRALGVLAPALILRGETVMPRSENNRERVDLVQEWLQFVKHV